MIPSLEELQENTDFKIAYVVLAYTQDAEWLKIIHLCAYIMEPSPVDMYLLRMELIEDEEFGISKEMEETFQYKIATAEEYNEIFNVLSND